jgi:hypothetical protein
LVAPLAPLNGVDDPINKISYVDSSHDAGRGAADPAAPRPQDSLAAGQDILPGRRHRPDRLGGRGIGIRSLRKTAINDAIPNGATMHEVREFAGHSDIRTTELYFVRREEDAEVAARRIQIRVMGPKPRPTGQDPAAERPPA